MNNLTHINDVLKGLEDLNTLTTIAAFLEEDKEDKNSAMELQALTHDAHALITEHKQLLLKEGVNNAKPQ